MSSLTACVRSGATGRLAGRVSQVVEALLQIAVAAFKQTVAVQEEDFARFDGRLRLLTRDTLVKAADGVRAERGCRSVVQPPDRTGGGEQRRGAAGVPPWRR